jgi:hypothetical protein
MRAFGVVVLADEIKFDRTPYTVKYVDLNGKQQSIRRVPPEKLHEALPTDVVTLTRKRSDDFTADNDYEVQYISPRNPNVLQLKKPDGNTTFVEYFDTELHEEGKVAFRNGEDPRERAINSKYLLWP